MNKTTEIEEQIEDHAGYLREGGCSKIIETLAIKGCVGQAFLYGGEIL